MGKRREGDGGIGGVQLSGSAAKLITMMDYNTLYRCPLPARLSCLRGSFATSVCVTVNVVSGGGDGGRGPCTKCKSESKSRFDHLRRALLFALGIKLETGLRN